MCSVGRVGGMLLLLLLLLLKYYPEEKNFECLLLKRKQKMFQIDPNSDLKEELDLKSRFYFTLFELVYNARILNMSESQCGQTCLDMCNVVHMPEYA